MVNSTNVDALLVAMNYSFSLGILPELVAKANCNKNWQFAVAYRYAASASFCNPLALFFLNLDHKLRTHMPKSGSLAFADCLMTDS